MSQVYWRTKTGEQVDVDDMDVDHLRNTLKFLIRGGVLDYMINNEQIVRDLTGEKKREIKPRGDAAQMLHDLEIDNMYAPDDLDEWM